MLAEVLPVLVRSFAAVYRAECAQNSVGQDPQGSTLFSGCFVWVSWIVCLADRKERSTKSHESATKQEFGLYRILNLSSQCLILSRNRPERVSDFGVRSSKLSAFFTRTFQYDSWHRMGC